jgi:4-oxalocrotonate tautomerase
VPHINIKHFSASLCEEQRAKLVAVLTAAVRSAFGCDERMISVALEPVDGDACNERVWRPGDGEQELLCKTLDY